MPIDYKKYPPNWKSEIVPAVIDRAGNCCEECGLQNHSIVFSIKLWVKDENGRYKLRRIWFRHEGDAKRETSGYGIKTVRVVLTVAHLDHDELNHEVSLDRLRALCQICHLRYDAKEKFQRQARKWNSKPSTF